MQIEIRGAERLSFRERQVVVLKEMGYSNQQVARRLGIEAGTVATLFNRARRKGYQVVIVLSGDALQLFGPDEEEDDDLGPEEEPPPTPSGSGAGRRRAAGTGAGTGATPGSATEGSPRRRRAAAPAEEREEPPARRRPPRPRVEEEEPEAPDSVPEAEDGLEADGLDDDDVAQEA